MLARAHQGKLDCILNVFDMEGATIGTAAHQRQDDLTRQGVDELAHARGGCALAAIHR